MTAVFCPSALGADKGNRKAYMKNCMSLFSSKKSASGGKVCHLESGLRMRFFPRFSGNITSAFDQGWTESVFLKPICLTF